MESGRMSTDLRSSPLVSILTPVYNNREDIAECIESVLAQTYQNWDYTIVDNCSTDGSGEVARSYAAKDPRIRVVANEVFLRAVPNHNVTLRQISPASKYSKIVFADDALFPHCVEQMVAVAEAHPSIGIVGAYGIQGADVMWQGITYPGDFVQGREICRRLFFDRTYVFGTSTSVLYRSDLVRKHDPFFNEANLHADMESCVVLLKESDFGFVHQILTFKRWRPESLTSFTEDVNTIIAGQLYVLVKHGRDFLTPEEFDRCLKQQISEYYNFLAVNLLRRPRDKKFWDYHRNKLIEAGVSYSRTRLARAAVARAFRAILNPNETLDKLRPRSAGTSSSV
jgi:glycosyltransferase involved in cell wall biosynthesis